MGNAISRAISGTAGLMSGRKRRRPEPPADKDKAKRAEEVLEDDFLTRPRKKQLLSTPKYIYKSLFQEHQGADTYVHAMGRIWPLHRIYLCQSPYFHSLFSGSWREKANDGHAYVEIIDPQITMAGLEIVFGSLYNNEVEIRGADVVSVLAAATLFQLDSLIERCAEVMLETTTGKTIIAYYESANNYGLRSVADLCLRWLLVNLLIYYEVSPSWLRSISLELMTKLVLHPDIFLVQTEFSMYVMLRKWMFVQLGHCDWDQCERSQSTSQQLHKATPSSATTAAITASTTSDSSSSASTASGDYTTASGDEEYPLTTGGGGDANSGEPFLDGADYDYEAIVRFFAKRPASSGAFLHTAAGRPYEPLFRQLRFMHMLYHPVDLNVLLRDNIVPAEWLFRPCLQLWNSMLLVDQSYAEKGLTECDRDTFLRQAIRCGRYFSHETGTCKWRWTGFNFGLDLLWTIDGRTLSLKRNHRADDERLLSLQPRRSLVVRVTVCALNRKNQVICTQSTDILPITLNRNEELQLMKLQPAIRAPFMLSMNMMVNAPSSLEVAAALEPVVANEAAAARRIINIQDFESSGVKQRVYVPILEY